jgi:hypothetical protein
MISREIIYPTTLETYGESGIRIETTYCNLEKKKP